MVVILAVVESLAAARISPPVVERKEQYPMRAMRIMTMAIASTLFVCYAISGEDRGSGEEANAVNRGFLPLEQAVELAKDAVRDNARFEGMFVTSARLMLLSERIPALSNDLPPSTQSVWRVDFSAHYPYPPGARRFVEVTHEGGTFVRSSGR